MSSNSTTVATDQKVANAGELNAPQANSNAAQANAAGSNALRAGNDASIRIDQSVKDSRNFGTQLGDLKLGNGSSVTVTTADPALAALAMDLQRQTAADSVAGQAYTAAAALNANSDVSRAALSANLGAVSQSLATVQATNADAFATQRDAIAALQEADKRRERITTEAINAGLDMGRQASASAEEVTRNALDKLAEQRAPDGANLVKVALWVVAAVALVFGLRALPRLFRRPAPRS